jgi:hypothetical protein
LLKKSALLSAGVAVVLSIAACSEKLESGQSCPLLCPEQSITLRDTTIDAVTSDTTVTGLPPIGSEAYMMLASHGDTVETRAIVRFDTLQQHYTSHGLDSVVTKIDSAILVVPIVKPDSAKRPKAPVTISVYDVDTTATDTVSSILGSLFREDRLLGSKTFAPESLLDTLRIPISRDTVLDRTVNGTRLRVGFRLVSAAGYDLQIGTTDVGRPVRLRVVTSAGDTAAAPILNPPISKTPADQPFLMQPLTDYTIVIKGQTGTQGSLLSVGGVPPRRAFMRFNVPSRIVDSTTIVRATLLLTQSPNRRLTPSDSGQNGQFGLDSLRLAPGDSGLRSFEIVGLVRTWRGQKITVSPRTLALRSGAEGQRPAQIDFFSSKAPAAVRPRLRITYVPQTSFGLP